jgi:hypothetical protein
MTTTRVVTWGAIAGVVASVARGMVAMIAAATYQRKWFFTPLYHIASLVIPSTTMMHSAMAAANGTVFPFSLGPAVLGLMIHMMVGAGFGAAFGLILTRIPGLAFAGRVVAGTVFGIAAFAASAFVLLPLMSLVANDSHAIRDMASIVGYPTFLLEHVVFGMVLGAAAVSAPVRERVAAGRAKVTVACPLSRPAHEPEGPGNPRKIPQPVWGCHGAVRGQSVSRRESPGTTVGRGTGKEHGGWPGRLRWSS